MPPPPILTPDRVTEIVVDRVFGFAPPEAVAVGALLVSVDPESARLAETIEARVRDLLEHTEDPVARFERFTGIRLDVDLR